MTMGGSGGRDDDYLELSSQEMTAMEPEGEGEGSNLLDEEAMGLFDDFGPGDGEGLDLDEDAVMNAIEGPDSRSSSSPPPRPGARLPGRAPAWPSPSRGPIPSRPGMPPVRPIVPSASASRPDSPRVVPSRGSSGAWSTPSTAGRGLSAIPSGRGSREIPRVTPPPRAPFDRGRDTGRGSTSLFSRPDPQAPSEAPSPVEPPSAPAEPLSESTLAYRAPALPEQPAEVELADELGSVFDEVGLSEGNDFPLDDPSVPTPPPMDVVSAEGGEPAADFEAAEAFDNPAWEQPASDHEGQQERDVQASEEAVDENMLPSEDELFAAIETSPPAQDSGWEQASPAEPTPSTPSPVAAAAIPEPVEERNQSKEQWPTAAVPAPQSPAPARSEGPAPTRASGDNSQASAVLPVPPKMHQPSPPPPELAGARFLSEHMEFRAESRRLARMRNWADLAEITAQALEYASWAAFPEVRSALLLELARLYSEQLTDEKAAEQTFLRLIAEDTTNRDALSYLDELYRKREQHRSIHDLYMNAVEGTWDPAERLSYTRDAVALAVESLHDPDLAIADWERLWHVGERGEDVVAALSKAYRHYHRWQSLARFLKDLAETKPKESQRVILREVGEIYLSALRAPEQAASIIERIRAERPQDPLALLSAARIAFQLRDVDQLVSLGRISGLPEDLALDIHRISADALWQSGERDLAVEIYETLLERNPDDHEALRAKESHFTESGNYASLCSHLEARAARFENLGEPASPERLAMLKRAALIAEQNLGELDRAISLWHRVIEAGEHNPDSYKKLISLYELIGNLSGVAQSLEGLLTQTFKPSARAEILARLGELYCRDLDDDNLGEERWRAVLAIHPGNRVAQSELAEIYARRGDFEALDQTLARQLVSAADEDAIELARAIAVNVDEHLDDARRSVAAWEQALDFVPAELDALASLARRNTELSRESEAMAALELRIQAAQAELREELCLELAARHRNSDHHAEAVEGFERVLCWNPTQAEALQALESLSAVDERPAVRSALELAANLESEPGQKIQLLRRSLGLLSVDQHDQRISLLRRLNALGDEAALEDLRREIDLTGRFEELLATYSCIIAEAEERSAREEAIRAKARLLEKSIENPHRAFLSLSAMGFDAERHAPELEELQRLAASTERWEELLVILEGMTSRHFGVEQRRQALLQRIAILEEKLHSPIRAVEDYRRLLMLQPDDDASLRAVEKLALDAELPHQLLGIYGELWDKANDDERRLELARKRHELLANVLQDKTGALSELLLQLRLAPSPSLIESLLDYAKTEQCWHIIIPRLVALSLSRAQREPAELLENARLCEAHLSNTKLAFELIAAVLLEAPDHGCRQELERLATTNTDLGRLAQALRFAAARASSTEDALSLYRQVAQLYLDELREPHRAIAVHRRMLRLAPDEIPSLDAVIAWHRERSDWSDLRDRLRQRIELGGDAEMVTELWMEVATVSADALNDPESALEAYSRILALDPEHAEARAAVTALTAGNMGPEVTARRLRLELKLCAPEERAKLQLSLARVQDQELKQPEAARETLETLVQESGPCGPGYKPLSALLERLRQWNELIELIEAHADALEDELAKSKSLAQALALCDEHSAPAQVSERIARKLRAQRPDDNSLFERLARTLRAESRWEELVQLLEEVANATPQVEEKLPFQQELARTLDLALNRPDDALKVLKGLSTSRYPDPNALLQIATIARRREQLDGYLNAREQHAKLIDPAWAAIVHCHLAEVSDEHDKAAQVASNYRKARALDAENSFANEALRALGRRLRNWRSFAALLPDDNERELSWAKRGQQLRARGLERLEHDLKEALSFQLRAVAVDPDQVESWQALASVYLKMGKHEARLEAALGAVGAFERSVAPSTEQLSVHAKLLHEAAIAAREAGDSSTARSLDARAFALAPHFAPSALAMADVRESDGDVAGAFDVYNRILESSPQTLDEEQRNYAIFRRGALAAKLGNDAQAADDLRATVRRDALHAESLEGLAAIYLKQGHIALGLANLHQALVTAVETKARGELYYRMGQQWQDGLSDEREAGIYYEFALAHGASEPLLMKRALEHYRRQGRLDEALSMVDELIQNTDDGKTLATLWVTRGEIQEDRSADEATKAFDMALSYEPGLSAALDGLERMLAAREEWDQLADLVEGRIDAAESDHERATALARLAELAEKQLGDTPRANATLRRLLEIRPSAEVVEHLLRNLADSPISERLDLMESAVEFGSRRFDRAIEMGRHHLAAGRRLQAWAILSPLRVVIHMDPELKDILADLRGEFERLETNMASSISKIREIPSPLRGALLEAFTRLREENGPFGATSLDEITSGAVEVGESTPNGKTFAAMKSFFGIEEAQLFRAIELPEPVVVVDSTPPVVCIKTEIFQKASGNELFFWLAQALELLSNDIRPIAAIPLEKRELFAPALLAALHLAEAPKGAEALVKQLESEFTEELATELKGIFEFALENGTAEASEFWAQCQAAAERAGALVVADLRAAWRALNRIYPEIIDQRSIKSIDDLNNAFGSSAVMSRVLRFYVSESFSSCFDS